MNWLQLLSARRPGDGKKTTAPNAVRSAFEQDYDRIIFSSPFRMLQDKTQVFPLPKHDFVHTRLTHSLEVSSVGRSLGKKVGETIIERTPKLKDKASPYDFGAIVAAGCLTHDLGNPPFGHSGEDAISEFFKTSSKGLVFREMVSRKEWADLTNFEGNAQGFRILNKKQYQGLRLTVATLAAFSKYPRESGIVLVESERKSQKKYGFYQTEKEIFNEVAEEVGLLEIAGPDRVWRRHPLAFLVEAADDICYHIIDLEDGCNAGLVSFERTSELLGKILGPKYKPEKLARIHSVREKVGALRALAIGELIEQSTRVFLDHEQDILKGRFDRALTELVDAKDIMSDIIELSVEKIYRSDAVTETEAAGFEVLDGLMQAYAPAVHDLRTTGGSARNKNLIRLMPEDIRYELHQNDLSVYETLRLCLDFISGLTDSHALTLFRRIKGIALPGY